MRFRHETYFSERLRPGGIFKGLYAIHSFAKLIRKWVVLALFQSLSVCNIKSENFRGADHIRELCSKGQFRFLLNVRELL